MDRNSIARMRDDRGSIDFVQLVVGLMIVAIACVGTFQALGFGYDHLNEQMRYRKALSIARSYLEYWQGRIHTDFHPSDMQTRAGNFGRGPPFKLDEGYPATTTDDIYCTVEYGGLQPVDQNTTGIGTDYWNINVQVIWQERGHNRGEFEEKRITLFGSMVAAEL